MFRSIPDLQHILTCTLSTCHESDSWYGYRPSLVPNAVILGLSALSLIGYALEGIFRPYFKGFTIVMVIGAFGEALGYLGRLLSHLDPFSKPPWIPYIMQSVCLTVSPIFLAAGLYIIFPEVMHTLDIQYIRYRDSIPRVFISCDIFAFLLLSAGAGLLASPRPTMNTTTAGFVILSVGVVFQALTLAIFIAVGAYAARRNWARLTAIWAIGETSLLAESTGRRAKYATRGVLIALPVSALVILIERIYYAVEIISGHGRFSGPEALTIFLEGMMICIAMLVLNLFHPGFCLKTGAGCKIRKDTVGPP